MFSERADEEGAGAWGRGEEVEGKEEGRMSAPKVLNIRM